MKKHLGLAAVCAAITIGLVAVFVSGNSPKTSAGGGEVISQQGIHWHPVLKIYVKGQRREVPPNIGIGKQYAGSKWYDPMMEMTDFHTHDSSGKLHWEVMEGPVTRDHVTLGAFFQVWGQKFDSTHILDQTSGSGGQVKMTVNGQPNAEFNNYSVKDGDKIVISYE